MSQFTSLKCDECGAIRGESNHWIQIRSFESENAGVLAISIGKLSDLMDLTRTAPPVAPKTYDACGQNCAVKHIARLLGWGSVIEREDNNGEKI